MKQFKKFISVFLCAVLCCSVFAVSAQAKTVKKYVKSISLAKKATITIPANKKSITKKYKVTVKVAGKASKKFTANSNKTSVAAVKVSGSYIKVTAKKAGKATITVTTKAKNAKNKKLSKKLTLTVKKTKAEPVSKAYLDTDCSDLQLEFSPYLKSEYLLEASQNVDNLIYYAEETAEYTAKIADESVAYTGKDKSGYLCIFAKSLGTTTAVISEKFNGKVRVLGTVNITVTETSLENALFGAVMAYYNDEVPLIWIKSDLGADKSDLNSLFKEILVDNKELGTSFKEDEFTVSAKINDESIAAIDASNVITGVKNGETNMNVTLNFTNGTEFESNFNIKVTGNAIEKVDGYTMENIRDYIVGLDTPVELKDGTMTPMINFDNAATTPAFKIVEDAIEEELRMYGSIGRGFSQKSNHSTDVYNSVRDKVLQFLGADPEYYTCFYTNSTTDGLNKLASALVEDENDIVLTTRIEHHANDLSWRERCKVIYAEVDEKGRVIYDDIERLLKENDVKILSISAASNVTGYVNDIHRAAKLAHKYGAMIVVDGAQIVAHRKVMMIGDPDDPDDDIDFIAFSAHKMYSPYGGGAVVGITKELNKHMPTFYGGGTIKVVGDDWVVYKDAPAAYEAGSPNYPGVVGLGKAIDVLSTVGMDKIEAHEKVLNRKIIDGLKKLPNIIIYGDTENIDDKVGVVTFNFSDINTYFISQKLSELGGVATRRGAFCAHPYVWRLMGISDETVHSFESCTDINTAGMVRVSFGIYNNEEEVDKFLELMPNVMTAAVEEQEKSNAVPEY